MVALKVRMLLLTQLLKTFQAVCSVWYKKIIQKKEFTTDHNYFTAYSSQKICESKSNFKFIMNKINI